MDKEKLAMKKSESLRGGGEGDPFAIPLNSAPDAI